MAQIQNKNQKKPVPATVLPNNLDTETKTSDCTSKEIYVESIKMHPFEQYLKILQLYHENSRFPPSFKFWSVSAIQKHWEEVKTKMHPAWILRPKSTFLTTPILVAGTNSVSSGNILDESFFDKYFAEKLKVPTII